MPRFCCPECFGDRGLKDDIIPSLGSALGSCDFCSSVSVQVIAPRKLREHFEHLMAIYETGPEGRTIVEWLKDDWQLFSHPTMSVAHAKDLLAEILDDGQIVRQTFALRGVS